MMDMSGKGHWSFLGNRNRMCRQSALGLEEI